VAVGINLKVRLADCADWQQDKRMFRKANQREKRNLSPHQKQIRFFIGLSLFIIISLTILLFWLANRGFAPH
jgi:hypothetical protein